jgi:putative flippase GtrA
MKYAAFCDQLARFIAVGLLNTAFGYGIFAALLYLGLHYVIALFIATISGILFNFKTTGRLVFKSNSNRLIFHFAGVYALIYAVHVCSLEILLGLGINVYWAGAMLILPMASFAFFLNKRFVFKNDQAN